MGRHMITKDSDTGDSAANIKKCLSCEKNFCDNCLSNNVRRKDPERMKAIRELVDRGLTVADVARELNLTTTTVYSYLDCKGDAKTAREMRAQARDKMFQADYDKGLTDAYIAAHTGFGRATVKAWRIKKGLPSNSFGGRFNG